MITELLRETYSSRFLTGQGVASAEPQLLTGQNYAELKRGVFVQNLSSAALFIGDENVTQSTGFLLGGCQSHLFPVDASGRLYVIGQGHMKQVWDGETMTYNNVFYENNTFTWYAQ